MPTRKEKERPHHNYTNKNIMNSKNTCNLNVVPNKDLEELIEKQLKQF